MLIIDLPFSGGGGLAGDAVSRILLCVVRRAFVDAVCAYVRHRAAQAVTVVANGALRNRAIQQGPHGTPPK